MNQSNEEIKRLESCTDNKTWRKWGPYMTERQWGTVREDYSKNGDTWNFISHEDARSNAYRWGEEGIAGFCDARQILCLAPVFWNGRDPILKERLFGLTNNQGNHGEDVKEVYFHLDSTPTHSYCKYLYKYPAGEFPYEVLAKNNKIGRDVPEYELADTGIFNDGQYFDCNIEYAKADFDDVLMRVSVTNRGSSPHQIHVLPHLWFRNFWKHNPRYRRPTIGVVKQGCITSKSIRNGTYYLYHEGSKTLFCENETNNKKIYRSPNETNFVKDGINDHVIHGSSSVNPANTGTKCAIWYEARLKPGETRTFRVRLSKHEETNPWGHFDEIFKMRLKEADEYYSGLCPGLEDSAAIHLLRSAFSGLLWTKQFYYFDVHKWLKGGPGEVPPRRKFLRNDHWQHLTNRDIISMPDTWEYPWYAAWDLAFHAVTFSELDPAFAKSQLRLMLNETYMHPNGQIPAYEWNFSDVNPPVHSWAVWRVYSDELERNGTGDQEFLEFCFQKLLANFTWWVNQKDKDDLGLFEGGFMGLDNIGVFDRNHMPSGIKSMQQADATSWMALFALNMMRISIELAPGHPIYEDWAARFFRQFLNIAWAMHNIGGKDVSLWDDKDAFYYDVIRMESGYTSRMKVRSLVGLIPLFAVEVIHKDRFNDLARFMERVRKMMRTRPDLASLVSRIEEQNDEGFFLFSIMRGYRLEHVVKRLLDEAEFLSPFGIRSLSKYHKEHPFVFKHHGEYSVSYEPGESSSGMFGGNSNWRGPVWLPINYLIIQSLKKFYTYFGPSYVYEYPTGSGIKLDLNEIALELTKRLLRVFDKGESGAYRYHNLHKDHVFVKDPEFNKHHLFYEYFHGDHGRGLGASHQTGWTALIANLILDLERESS